MKRSGGARRTNCGVLEEIHQQFDLGGDKVEKVAQLVLENESENILEGWAWAGTNFRTNDAAAELCDRYAAAAMRIGLRYFPMDLSIRWAGVALRSVKRLGLPIGRHCLHLIHLAQAYTRLGDATQAGRTLSEASRLVERHRIMDPLLEARIADTFTDILLLEEEWQHAAESARGGLPLVTPVCNDRRLQFSIIWRLAEALRGMGDYDGAVQHYHNAAICALFIGDKGLEAMAAAGLALAQMQRGAIWPGRYLLRRARRLARKSKDLQSFSYFIYAEVIADLIRGRTEKVMAGLGELLAIAREYDYWRIGNVAMRDMLRLRGTPEESLKWLIARDTLEQVRLGGSRRAEAHKLIDFADFIFNHPEVTRDNAKRLRVVWGLYQDARLIAHEITDADLVARVTANLTAISFNQGDPREVVRLATNEMPNLVVAADPRYHIEVRKRLGDSYLALGRIDAARAEYSVALTAAEEVDNRQTAEQIKLALASL
jgi:tetratricopeptide (TPR) repeat protein